MSPTIFRHGPFRFFFFSREEPRMHVHVSCSGGEAKFWIEPCIEVAQNKGLDDRQLKFAMLLVRNHEQQIRTAWSRHFGA